MQQCYHCASPEENIDWKSRRKNVESLRAIYQKIPPMNNEQCSSTTNFGEIPRVNCSSGYCLKHLIDDYDGIL